MNMKRYRFIWVIATIALAVSACVKDLAIPSKNSEELFEVGFNLRIEPVTYTMTKAENINADELDDFIDRIDMYEYNNGKFIKAMMKTDEKFLSEESRGWCDPDVSILKFLSLLSRNSQRFS